MDLKSITTLLADQESTFRTILSSASSSISGDALKSKLTQHYINLILIARNRFSLSDLTLDDPFEFGSDPTPLSSSPSNGSSRSRKRRNRTPPIEGQMTAVPIDKDSNPSRSQRWKKAGGSNLFNGGGRGTETEARIGNKRFGKGVAIPLINLLNTTDSENDDSAGSAPEEGQKNSIFDIERKFKKAEKRGRGTKRDRNGLSREEKEKEKERNRDREPGMGMSGSMGITESTKRGGLGARTESVHKTEAGFEGRKEEGVVDWDMQDRIMNADSGKEGVQVKDGFKGDSKHESGGESPPKRHRST
jgi:hypothetical protein